MASWSVDLSFIIIIITIIISSRSSSISRPSSNSSISIIWLNLWICMMISYSSWNEQSSANFRICILEIVWKRMNFFGYLQQTDVEVTFWLQATNNHNSRQCLIFHA
jgi:hypothetical protein